MRFRLGLALGFGTGYVLGAKAGHERYEQIASMARKIAGSGPAQQLTSEIREVTTQTGHKLEEKASEGVSKVTALVHGGTDGNGGAGDPYPPSAP